MKAFMPQTLSPRNTPSHKPKLGADWQALRTSKLFAPNVSVVPFGGSSSQSRSMTAKRDKFVVHDDLAKVRLPVAQRSYVGSNNNVPPGFVSVTENLMMDVMAVRMLSKVAGFAVCPSTH
ncbi:MAG: hypothetical protein HKN18_10275 [Silicimonas sp.]|nr:hypothetical protein [Silicimonas sp.]